jgi:hypothetical protein
MKAQQQNLDFNSPKDEAVAMIATLNRPEFATQAGISLAALHGAVELLTRIVVLARYVPEDRSQPIEVEAQVVALAARIERRKTVSERCIRKWRSTAEKKLGWLQVFETSHAYGGHQWNRWTIRMDQLPFQRRSEVIIPGGTGRNAVPVRAEPSSALNREVILEKRTHSLTPERSVQLTAADPWDVVVSALAGLGMCDAIGAVGLAQQRGLTHEVVSTFIARYVQLTAACPDANVGWLHRWISGKSRPPEATVSAVKRQSLLGPTAQAELEKELGRMRKLREDRKRRVPVD